MPVKPRIIALNGELVGGSQPPPPPADTKIDVASLQFLEIKAEKGLLCVRPRAPKGTKEFKLGIMELDLLAMLLQRFNVPFRGLQERDHEISPPHYFVGELILKI